MTKLEQAVTLALQQLNRLSGHVCEASHHIKGHQHGIGEPCPIELLHDEAITALRQALAESTDEPIAYVSGTYGGRVTITLLNPALVLPDNMALYTRQQPAVPVGSLRDKVYPMAQHQEELNKFAEDSVWDGEGP